MASTQKPEQLQGKQTLGVADADFAIAQRVHSHSTYDSKYYF